MRRKIFSCIVAVILTLGLGSIIAFAEEGIAIDSINFPNDYFRSCVAENYDSNQDGKLSESEISAVKQIYIGNGIVENLKGIEYFTELTELVCNDCGLEKLDLSQNTKLTRLELNFARITELDLSQNTELVELSCYSLNQVSTLDVSHNSKLKKLGINSGGISSLRLDQNPNLEKLDVRNNKLTRLDVSQNPNLSVLRCYGNNLTKLDVSQNQKLEELGCSYNKLTALDISQNPQLADLECMGNRLTNLDASKNTQLTFLNCENNDYTILTDADGKYDLTALPGAFDVSKASGWRGGSVEGSTLKVNYNTTKVSYDYDCGNGEVVNFVLNVVTDNDSDTTTINNNQMESITISQEDLEKVSENNNIVIEMKDATLKLSKEVVSNIKGKSGNLDITVRTLDDEELLTDAQKYAIPRDIDRDSMLIADIKATLDGEELHELAGKATISVSYDTAMLAQDEQPLVYYLAEDGRTERIREISVNRTNGKITFSTEHFSTFIISTKFSGVLTTGVNLDQTVLSIKTGEEAALTAVVAPETATNKTVIWKSDHEEVATVIDGIVTGVKFGSAKITVTTVDGYFTDTCTVTVVCAHANSTTVAAESSTCQIQGHEEYVKCNECGEIINGSDAKIPLADHNYGTLIEEKTATHTEAGVKAHYTCSVCAKNFTDTNKQSESIDLSIPATGHDEIMTWTTDDNKHWKICSCGEILDEATHDYQWFIETPATEDSIGIKYEECTVCQRKRSEGTEIPKLDHTHTIWMEQISAKKATCTEAGNNAYYLCLKCGKAFKDQTANVPTSVEAEVIAPLNHDYSIIGGSDEENHWMKCSRCNENGVKTSHTGGKASCTEKARCEVCNAAYGEVLEHLINVSMYDENQHWNKCAYCDLTSDKEDHNFGDDNICDICGYDKTHRHVGVGVVGVPATAEATGLKPYYKCECGKIFTDAACTVEVTEEDLLIAKLAPIITEGNGAEYMQGSKEGISFRSTAALADFVSVAIDGNTIESTNYLLREGSTIVTLKPEYLNTLSVGKHTIAINSTTGVASADFVIKGVNTSNTTNTISTSATPKTGDDTNTVLWSVLLSLSITTIIGIMILDKKKKSYQMMS